MTKSNATGYSQNWEKHSSAPISHSTELRLFSTRAAPLPTKTRRSGMLLHQFTGFNSTAPQIEREALHGLQDGASTYRNRLLCTRD
jgi:hypothetical protein